MNTFLIGLLGALLIGMSVKPDWLSFTIGVIGMLLISFDKYETGYKQALKDHKVVEEVNNEN